MTKLLPAANLFGHDVTAAIEAQPDGVVHLDAHLDLIWQQAAPLLAVRDNDAHTLYAYGLAQALLAA
ncbi:hypothetical protein, partial [Pandoraea pneumonica]